jgi:hypothetical protein
MSKFEFTTTKTALDELDDQIQKLYAEKNLLMHKGAGEWNATLRCDIANQENIVTFRLISKLLTRLERTLPVGSTEKQNIYHALNSCRASSEVSADYLEKDHDPFDIPDFVKEYHKKDA